MDHHIHLFIRSEIKKVQETLQLTYAFNTGLTLHIMRALVHTSYMCFAPIPNVIVHHV